MPEHCPEGDDTSISRRTPWLGIPRGVAPEQQQETAEPAAGKGPALPRQPKTTLPRPQLPGTPPEAH